MDLVDDAYQPWMERAICADSPEPDLWFPDLTTAETSAQVAAQVDRAIAVCNGCPVRLKCLTMALENGEKEGVWGGVSFTPVRSTGGKKAPKKATHCTRGHEFTDENTGTQSNGSRVCLACTRHLRQLRQMRSEARKEAA